MEDNKQNYMLEFKLTFNDIKIGYRIKVPSYKPEEVLASIIMLLERITNDLVIELLKKNMLDAINVFEGSVEKYRKVINKIIS
jgi:hypothetical protein